MMTTFVTNRQAHCYAVNLVADVGVIGDATYHSDAGHVTYLMVTNSL